MQLQCTCENISLVPRPSPSFPSIAVHHPREEVYIPGPLPLYRTASDGKLGEGLGTRL